MIIMNLKQFAEDTKNTTELNVTLQPGQIIITAYEEEFNHELEEVSANLDFIPNLEYRRVDSLTIIVNEVE